MTDDFFPPGIDAGLREETEAVVDNFRAWMQVLDQLERDVEATEELARSDDPEAAPQPGLWEPPAINGPVPEALLPRAAEIHRRQLEARAALGAALTAVRDQQQLTQRRSGAATTPATPAYVDISA